MIEESLLERLREPVRRLVGQSFLRAPLRAAHRAMRLRNNAVTVRIAGISVRFEDGTEPPVSRPADLVGAADYVFVRAFAEAIRPGDEVADVGAHAGSYTVVAAACTGPGGHVTAFEPSAESRAALVRNLEINGFGERVAISELAVSDTEGEAEFYSDGRSSTNSLVAEALQLGGGGAAEVQSGRVSTVTLDAFYQERGRVPQVVKVDIEGAEFRALRGARRILATDATVFCELHPYAWEAEGHTGTEMREWLASVGRVLVDLRTGEEPRGELVYGPFLLARKG